MEENMEEMEKKDMALTEEGEPKFPQKSKIRKFFKVSGNIVFVAFMLIMVFLVYSLVVTNIVGGPPTIAGHQMYIVLSGSMNPVFDTGALAFVKPLTAEEVELG